MGINKNRQPAGAAFGDPSSTKLELFTGRFKAIKPVER